jgi:hypothetical protein
MPTAQAALSVSQPGGPSMRAQVSPLFALAGSGGFTDAATQSFQVVEELDHQDNTWTALLTGDANHNGLQEIVIHHTPAGGSGSGGVIEFFEDDGTGQFHLVHSIPLSIGGLLAMGDVDGDGLTDLFFVRVNGPGDFQFVRWEASSPNGFPDHEVWSAPKEGFATELSRGVIADLGGVNAFITSDNDTAPFQTMLKVFEPAPLHQMALVFQLATQGDLGNPVVADFDGNGTRHIAVSDTSGSLYDVLVNGPDQLQLLSTTPTNAFRAISMAVIDQQSPDGRPMLFLAGQGMGTGLPEDFAVAVYEHTLAAPTFRLVNALRFPPGNCFAFAQIYAADLFGTPTPELVFGTGCGHLDVLTVGAHGSLSVFDQLWIPGDTSVVATPQSSTRAGAIAVALYGTVHPMGHTLLLELQ